MRKFVVVLSVTVAMSTLASAGVQKKNCEELKSEIAAKLDAKGVKNYTLEIVAAESVKDEKVVGTCDGGSKKITYKRN
ncbi:MAG: DUF1161 domain-containing protein [Acidobacteria bacterium]|nr:DUF1161 domain-containing protein [Acidobacteriota bacterium]